MSSPPRTILVTGASRGIGFSILQALATKSPSDRYLLGTRTIESGHAAVAQLPSPSPRVIHNSSERGSLARNLAGTMPPTMVVAYNVSKTALNALTIQQRIAEPRVKLYAANPGFCKTAFNRFRGSRDPLDGANVFAELAFAPEEKYESGFWEMGDQDWEARTVPW
ncbi:MAG: hypothetical protein Q9167_005370 [Letrouitia subvulpina]